MQNKRNTPGEKLSSHTLQKAITDLLAKNPGKKFSPGLIKKILKVDNNSDSIKYALEKAIEKLKSPTKKSVEKNISQSTTERKSEYYEGIVDMTRSGAAYIICDSFGEDIYVQPKYIQTALDRDKVQVRLFKGGRRNRAEGEIVKILERNTTRFICTLLVRAHKAIARPEQIVLPFDIEIDAESLKSAGHKDKVVIEIYKWPAKGFQSALARITQNLGKEGGINLAMNSILINNGFNIDFPEEVKEEASRLSEKLTKEDMSTRRDFRNVLTFTIDPEDAKDFDDALSYRILDDGNVEIGVHIADVSYYVTPGTALDKEAYFRSTSVYLADRSCPMLPETISNELCSLRPNEDKRTYSAVFTFDKKNKIIDRWFGRTLIHSDKRFSYEQAQQILDSKEGELAKEILAMNEVAISLRKERYKKGSINFESDEVRFKFDEAGHPVSVFIKERHEANLLIEDFMLLANREVATFIHNKAKGQEIPFVYRVHDLPSLEKLEQLSLFAKELGFDFNASTPDKIKDSFNRLAKASATDDALKLLEPLAIRTMAKAEYTTVNIGHYGLAFDFYTHFTSPIRRYSDVLSHRILEKNLTGIYREDKEVLEAQCKHISSMERHAMDAERQSVKYFQVMFLEDKVGQTFEGIVAGIIERGLFIELTDSKCEGMLPFDSLYESFDVEPSRLKATGKRTGRIFKMGDRLKVKVMDTDLEARQINFELEQEQ